MDSGLRRNDEQKKGRIMKTRKEILAAIAKNKADLKAFLDGIGEKALSPEEINQADAFLATNTELLGELAKCDESDARKKSLREMGGVLPAAGAQPSEPAQAKQGRINYGKAFVESEEYKSWMKQVAPNGSIPESGMPASPPVGFKTLLTGESATSAGAFVQTDYTGLYEPLGRAPLSILDLITRRSTISDLVEFVRQTAQITQAANVQEANVATYAAGTGEISGAKPQAAMTFEQVTQAVQTIAAWIPATRRAIADAGQLMGIINGDLRDDLLEHLEYQMVVGNGAGANFTGLFSTANVLVQAWDTDVFRTTRLAKTYLRVTGRTIPTAWLMNPADWEDLDLEKDLQGRYYFGGPVQMGVKTLWGVPVVECEYVTEGTAILGDFRKAVLWDRESATIRISEHHEDYFTRNMIAVLAEMRCAFGLIRPTAFVKVAMESGT
jgi:HK97 family phage major capsid protein